MRKIIYLLCIMLPCCGFSQQVTKDSVKFFTSFDGVKIHYEVQGFGEPVLLVHGFIVNGESWKRTALYNDLLVAGFKVITLDMRGNGLSDKPHTPEAYEKDAESRDIMGLLTRLGVKKYSVVGYSRGSIITARLLVLDAARIDKAVLGGMGSDFTNPEWPRRIMFYKALMGEDVPELAGAVKYIKDTGLDQQALAYMQKGQPSTSVEALGAIKKPVLVLCGDRDEDNGSSETLASLIPGAIYKRVPGDHNNTARSQGFSDQVLAFLKKK
ncbi:MAG TPA: alpha/beta hydrolase [Ohtaekwangia sp.]|uniref:alpha/beta fold hydrolase n=1 Tax=Ohtaekwangia sp. TaxID=2066019 RepID=UPI002F955411